MTEETETRCLNCGCNSPCGCSEPMPAAEAYSSASLRQVPAAGSAVMGAVTVKPLVWEADEEHPDCLTADAYDIWHEGLGYQVYFWSVVLGVPHQQLVDAQDYAWRHHQARILAALSQPEVLEMVECAAHSAGYEAGELDEAKAAREPLLKALLDTLTYIDKGHVEMARNIAAAVLRDLEGKRRCR